MENATPSRFIVGAGRHAEETFYLLEDLGEADQVQGFVVDAPGEIAFFLQRPLLSTTQFLEQHAALAHKPALLVAIGDIGTNKRLCAQFAQAGFPFFQAINPNISLQRQCYIGKGVTIAQGSILTTNVTVGDFSIINVGCTLSHDVVIGQHVNISPGAHLAGHVHIADEVFIGIGANVIPRVKVGQGSIIAAGACVTKDVPPGCMVAGVPAIIKRR